MSVKRRYGWTRRAAAWLVAFALSLGVLPSLQAQLVSAGPADPFVAADICASHGPAEDGRAAGSSHDCRQHCCLISAQSLPPAPIAVRPASLAVATAPPSRAFPAPETRPDPVHPARAPPFPVV